MGKVARTAPMSTSAPAVAKKGARSSISRREKEDIGEGEDSAELDHIDEEKGRDRLLSGGKGECTLKHGRN